MLPVSVSIVALSAKCTSAVDMSHRPLLTERILYGVCYQAYVKKDQYIFPLKSSACAATWQWICKHINSDSKDDELTTAIIPTIAEKYIHFENYTFDASSGAGSIDCIWFDSPISADKVDSKSVPADFEHNQDVQEDAPIVCWQQEIHIDDRYWMHDILIPYFGSQCRTKMNLTLFCSLWSLQCCPIATFMRFIVLIVRRIADIEQLNIFIFV